MGRRIVFIDTRPSSLPPLSWFRLRRLSLLISATYSVRACPWLLRPFEPKLPWTPAR